MLPSTIKKRSALLLALAGCVTLTACGGAHTPSASQADANGPIAGQSITVYSGQHEQTTALLVAAFEKRTKVKVGVRSDDEAALGNQVLQEGTNSPADVFYAENTPVLERLSESRLLATLPQSILSVIPAAYNSNAGDWAGVSARISVLVYNRGLIAESALPGSILELTQPRWKGKLAIAPSETDFQPLITAVAKSYGTQAAERWLSAIKANSKIYPDNETVVSQVNNGESEIGLINHYYWYRLRDEVGSSGLHSALHYYNPDDPGDLLNVSGAAVLASSSHKAAAEAFVSFLLSREGQELIARSHSYEYPLRPGVKPASGLRPFDQLRPASITPADLGNGSTPLELEQKLGLL